MRPRLSYMYYYTVVYGRAINNDPCQEIIIYIQPHPTVKNLVSHGQTTNVLTVSGM